MILREVLSLAVQITFSGQIDRYISRQIDRYIDRYRGRCCPQPCLSRSQTRQIYIQIEREVMSLAVQITFSGQIQIDRQIDRQIEREVMSLVVHITFSGQIWIDRYIDRQRGRCCPQPCISRSQARYRQIDRYIEREVMSLAVQITFSGQIQIDIQIDREGGDVLCRADHVLRLEREIVRSIDGYIINKQMIKRQIDKYIS